MEKINIAELLQDCPKGMELYSPLFGDCKFVKVHDYEAEIIVELETGATVSFLTDGRYYDYPNAECILFPKGKTTWEGFTPPCQLKDGDILSNGICICLYNGNESDKYYGFYVGVGHIDYPNYFINHPQNSYFTKENSRFATKEEKAKLFASIKAHGYKWNSKTKTLEELPKPKFKVGDRVRNKNYKDYIYDIHDIIDKGYRAKEINADSPILILFGSQEDNYELVPNKLDISTLKPFDKVLVRNKSNEVWTANFYSHYDATSDKPFICVGWSEMNEYRYCIPYEVNNELLGTTNNTEEYGSR